MEYYINAWKNFAVFSGRTRRKEYWMFALINIIIIAVISFLEILVGSPGIIGSLYSLAILIPSIAIAVRRLHDTGRSGWWLLLLLIPFLGGLILLIFMVLNSQPGTNEYGPNPKGIA